MLRKRKKFEISPYSLTVLHYNSSKCPILYHPRGEIERKKNEVSLSPAAPKKNEKFFFFFVNVLVAATLPCSLM